MFRFRKPRNDEIAPGLAVKRNRIYAMSMVMVMVLVASQALVACQSGGEPTATFEEVQAPPTVIEQPTQEEVPTPTSDQGPSAEESAPQDSLQLQMPSLGEPMPGCTVVSFNPTPEPTLQALFPSPGEEDWIKGPDTAAVTIIEYSDFQ
jgi:hypothetical protein